MKESVAKVSAYGGGYTVHFGHGKSLRNRERWLF
jgi:hypothetical protein